MSAHELAATFVDALAGPDVGALRSLLDPMARFWVNLGPTTFSTDYSAPAAPLLELRSGGNG